MSTGRVQSGVPGAASSPALRSSKRRPRNRCESCDEVCSKSYFFYSKLTILDFDAARGNRQRQPLDDAVTGRVITA